MGKREGPIEDYLIEQVLLHGGLSEKHVSPGRNGVPDQLVTWNGLMDLVETKAPLGERSGTQIRDHTRRLKRGVIVFTLHTKEQVNQYIKMRELFWLS
jgi:hypothetical protein